MMTTMVFRRLERSDFPLLSSWLATPHVARWWAHDPAPAALEADFGAVIDRCEPGDDYIAAIEDAASNLDEIGLVQFCMIDDYPDEALELRSVLEVPDGAATVDYLLGDATRVGKGLGRQMVGAFVDRLWGSRPDVSAILVPVHVDNPASWRMLQAIGFTVVARAELTPDNPIDSRAHLILRRDRPPTAMTTSSSAATTARR